MVSKILVDSIDWEKIYNDTSDYSKSLFKKEEIIDRIIGLLLKYPDHFDTSHGRLEFGTSVFKIRYGILNDYIYILSDYEPIGNNGWFLTEQYFFNYLKNHKNTGKYHVCFNRKNILRKLKIEKLKNNIDNAVEIYDNYI